MIKKYLPDFYKNMFIFGKENTSQGKCECLSAFHIIVFN